ncbi:MAG TPA: hypothetical protein VNL17_09655 [Verrucomicrobiae bacterium]|nr:hypothetical protein [Verrucomicrobiae bacterium]
MDRENLNVEIAVLLSLLLHLLAFGGWQYRSTLMRLPLFSLLSKLVQAAHPFERPAPQQVQTLTFVELAEPRAPEVKKGREAQQFMETDASQVTGEKPKDTKYYSDKSTVAANPNNPTDKTGDTPYLNGKETRAPNTLDVPTPSGASAPLIRQPGSPSRPPSPPKPAPKIAEATPESRPAPPPQPKAPEQPKEAAPLGLKMMEEQKVVMAQKPVVQPQVATGATVPEIPADSAAATPGSPAIVTEPGVPGREIVARKSHLTVAGVSRNGIAAFGVAESPFGAYDKKLIKAVQSHWYALIDHYGIYESADVVTVKFALLDDGQVQDVTSTDTGQSRILSLFCEKAIIESGPFDPLSDELRALIGKEPREISFTFYY